MTDDNTGSNAQNWGNYWQGRAASEAGAALVGVGVENDAQIAAFWDDVLNGLPKDAAVLDLACGAGSVLRRAKACGLSNLTGVDISPDAITTLKAAFPEVTGVAAPADATGLSDASFDMVASQFGFEYADVSKAATEAARLIKPGGAFVALAHIQTGAIETEVAAQLSDARAITDTAFIPLAKALFKVDMSGGSDADFEAALARFSPAQEQLLTIARRTGGLAEHLYRGTQTLYQGRIGYNLSDINGWLDGMAAEIAAFTGRMDSMRQAALSESEAQSVLDILTRSDMDVTPLDILTLGTDKVAWIIRAKTPA
ncbi:class I SAM-dependent methyltransferase [Fretibacter rubidus]|uniref:class I SAM-dependent methyltransferase n=1 Tax=Fretibacter rubidus TaxID=570162 RepID=UPI00352A7F9A